MHFFSTLSPGLELRLVQALQAEGKIVAMTGDGVYDNLLKFIGWTLPTNVGEGFVRMLAIRTDPDSQVDRSNHHGLGVAAARHPCKIKFASGQGIY